MSNANAFVFQIGEKECYADPLKVRRALLQNTLGKCWGIVREIPKLKQAILKARQQVEELETQLQTEAISPQEMEQMQEIQKLKEEGKTSTIPFEQMPRIYRKEGFEGQIAIFSSRVAELEGILATAAYVAFDLPQMDPNTGEGVTEEEAIGVLNKFLEYAEGKGERLGS